MLQKIKKCLFLVLLLTIGVTYFTRNNYKSVDEIVPGVTNQPVQKQIFDKKEIEFEKDDYFYKLTPLYDYNINALIVSKMDYRIFSLKKYDSAFPIDLCLIWGQNVANKVYQSKTIKFKQDCRWCWAEWHEDLDVNTTEVSNNHLLIDDEDIERSLKKLNRGDQIRIIGKLVNVEAKLTGEKGEYDPEEASWQTSTTREDSGAGACEIIYVEDLEILKKGNIISNYLFQFGFYGLLLLIIFNIVYFFYDHYSDKS